MNKPDANQVREMRQTFDLAGAKAQGSSVAPGGKVLRAKVFKSGNSLALRLPKALGLEAGMEMELRVDPDGGYDLKPLAAPKRKFNIAKVAGSAKKLKYVEPETRLFEARPSAQDLAE